MASALPEALARTLIGLAPDGRFALAFSGGLDSRFLAHAARLLGLRPLLLHAAGPHVPPEETAQAAAWAGRNGLAFRKAAFDPLGIPDVASGDRKRCYACKRGLMATLLAETDLPLCDGTNASDSLGYRPGIQALRELGVRSPLAGSGLTKADVRRLARQNGLDQPDQKARPCLLTRLPYGTSPTFAILSALASGEDAVLRVLEAQGMAEADFRLRLTSPARLELHLLEADAAALAPDDAQRLLRAAHRAAPDLPFPVLLPQASLSGFFDRTPRPPF